MRGAPAAGKYCCRSQPLTARNRSIASTASLAAGSSMQPVEVEYRLNAWVFQICQL